MFRIVNLDNSTEWDAIVKSFSEYDVYYLSGYSKAFFIHGDGEPFLMYYEDAGLRAIYVYLRRPTFLPGIYDSISPYGYGGVLFEGDISNESVRTFWDNFVTKMCEEKIVDNFVRYHPLLKNALPMKYVSDVIDLGKTVAMDLSSSIIIWDNLTSKNRNMIRKAEKNGVEISHGKDFDLFNDFRRIYNSTMDKDQAQDYYYFDEEFYKSIYEDLKDNFEMFYALYQGHIIAMSIILFANNRMHYHLSGSLVEYKKLAPSNLLLYKAALWGNARGYKTFHLGGGVGSQEDGLYKFKAAFNRKSDYQYSIGKQIYDQNLYNQLVESRKLIDDKFDESLFFFPLYRA